MLPFLGFWCYICGHTHRNTRARSHARSHTTTVGGDGRGRSRAMLMSRARTPAPWSTAVPATWTCTARTRRAHKRVLFCCLLALKRGSLITTRLDSGGNHEQSARGDDMREISAHRVQLHLLGESICTSVIDWYDIIFYFIFFSRPLGMNWMLKYVRLNGRLSW